MWPTITSTGIYLLQEPQKPDYNKAQFLVAKEEKEKNRIAGLKRCNRCGEIKGLDWFYDNKANLNGKQGKCKKCQNKYSRERYQIPEVKAKIKEQNQIPEVKAKAKEHRQLPEVKARRREKENERYHNDPLFRFTHNMKRRIRLGLKGHSKSKRAEKYLYCTFAEALDYLEKKFRFPMTKENMGEVWEVDHIRPVSSFDLSDPEQVKACFHYTNLQPLLVEENRAKHNKTPEEWAAYCALNPRE